MLDIMQLLALGSSVPFAPVGDQAAILRAAITCIGSRLGTIVAVSQLYGTRAWPDPSQPSYVNAAVTLASQRTPEALLQGMLEIELEFGRTRSAPNAPRTLDLDLIADGQVQLHSGPLTLPHPRMHGRSFVLAPVCDVWPQWNHPVFNATALQLWQTLKQSEAFDPDEIWLYHDQT